MKTLKDTLDAKFMVEPALPTRNKTFQIHRISIRNISID